MKELKIYLPNKEDFVSKDTLEQPEFKGKVFLFANPLPTLIFPRDSNWLGFTGIETSRGNAFLKNTSPSLWLSNHLQGTTNALITDDATMALLHHQEQKTEKPTLYISTGGAASREQQQNITDICQEHHFEKITVLSASQQFQKDMAGLLKEHNIEVAKTPSIEKTDMVYLLAHYSNLKYDGTKSDNVKAMFTSYDNKTGIVAWRNAQGYQYMNINNTAETGNLSKLLQNAGIEVPLHLAYFPKLDKPQLVKSAYTAKDMQHICKQMQANTKVKGLSI